jgi:hypothetical protein
MTGKNAKGYAQIIAQKRRKMIRITDSLTIITDWRKGMMISGLDCLILLRKMIVR